jgi:hypothetical protein
LTSAEGVRIEATKEAMWGGEALAPQKIFGIFDLEMAYFGGF